MQDQDVVREFLVESHENLSRLDQELVELEKQPKNAALLASVFRTIHTIKGTCGFLGFTVLEKITHQAETLLSQLRDGERELTPTLASLILETIDATRQVLASIEAGGTEGPDDYADLTGRLREMSLAGNLFEPSMPAVRALQANVAAGQGAAPPAKRDEETAKSSSVADSNIRVHVELLDKLMDLVGELVLTRNQILQFNSEREDAALNATSQRLNLITTELQEGVMKTRMQPIGMVWNKLPRVVRDMALLLGKQIRLEMEGTETELDRTIVEAIKDPLVHLVRNACDHGIESPEARARTGKPAQGRLTLRAFHEGGQVNIEIADDGAGIDAGRVKRKAIDNGLVRPEQAEKLSERETLNLIFLPGFSTAAAVTNISGRGVGMDVVKSNIERIGGVVDITSRPGEGATVRLKIPLTLAIIPGLLISSGGERFVIPQVSLLELIRLEGDVAARQIEQIHGTPVYRRRGTLLPIAYLNQVLGLPAAPPSEVINIVVLQAEDRQFGLVVDSISDTQEIVVKPMGRQLKGLNVYAGATIMGDGRVALILDVLGIGQRAGLVNERAAQGRASDDPKANTELQVQRLLLFRAGAFERLAVPLSLVARLEEFPAAAIELAGGKRVVQYRGGILPLVTPDAVLGGQGASTSDAQDPVQVIVFGDGERSLGLVVEQIVDIVEEAISVRQRSQNPGLLGSAVVGQRVTDFLDLNYLLEAGARGNGGTASPQQRVMVAEGSAFSRGLIRAGLDMAGYGVVEVGTLDEALRVLEHSPVDVVATALDLPPLGSGALLEAMRQRAEWKAIPVLALIEAGGRAPAATAGFEACVTKFDREAMLQSVAQSVAQSLGRLAGAVGPSGQPAGQLVGEKN